MIPDFGKKCQKILDKCLENYNLDARDYHKDVYLEKQAELNEELLNKFYAIFQKQSDQIKNSHLKNLADNLEDARTLDISSLPGILGDLEATKKEFVVDLK